MELEPRRNGVAGNDDTRAGSSAAGKYGTNQLSCHNCGKRPAAGSTFQTCGHCRTASYCSEACQRGSWPEHKLVCDSFRDVRERAVAGGTCSRSKKNFTQNLLETVPGVVDKVTFLAWKHRDETPIILVTASSANAATATSDVDVKIFPRTQWEDRNMWKNGDVITMTHAYLSGSTFHADNNYLLLLRDSSGETPTVVHFMQAIFPQVVHHIHSSALMTLTADDFAAEMVRRQTAPNAVFVRLTGLVAGAHLNGGEGVLRGRDPHNAERYTVRLEDDKSISVRSVNYERVQRPKVFNEEF